MSLEAVTVWHGVFGVVFIITFSAIAEILWDATPARIKKLRIIMVVTAVAVVLHVILGSYLYQFYRADIPTSPRSLILASDKQWLHKIFMEYKEFIGGLVPILSITALYAVFYYPMRDLAAKRGIRLSILWIVTIAFIFTLIAFTAGALITKYAPLGGGL